MQVSFYLVVITFFILFEILCFLSSGYLYTFSEQLAQNLDRIPGDDRTRIGFLAFDSCLHFFDFFDPNLPPRELIISEVDGKLFLILFLFLD